MSAAPSKSDRPIPRKRNALVPLSSKILLLALMNLALLAGLVLAVFGFQMRNGMESMLLGPASDRMPAIMAQLEGKFAVAPLEEWRGIVDQMAETYEARFYLSTPDGHYIAGEEAELPERVRAKFDPSGLRIPPSGKAAYSDDWMEAAARGEVLPAPPLAGGPPPAGRGPAFEGRGKGKGKGKGKGGPKGKRKGKGPGAPVFMVVTESPTRYWIGGRFPLGQPGLQAFGPGMLVVETDTIFNSHLFFDYRMVIGSTLAVLLASLLCWTPFVRRLTRSVRTMDAATLELADGNFEIRVNTERNDELGHLGKQINRMADRLSDFVGGQRRFLGDVAHELSAPIARIQTALAIVEHKTGHIVSTQDPECVRTQQQVRKTVQDLQEEVEHLADLVNELLQFSKAALRPREIAAEPIDVADAVGKVIAREGPAEGLVTTNIRPGLIVEANRAYFKRSVGNVVRNALRYAGDAGPVNITGYGAEGALVLVIADHGPGIPQADLDRIFEPFYRPEQSRSRKLGGMGLGLAIVKSGIETCGGTVSCRNRQPHGLEVTIRIPLAPEPKHEDGDSQGGSSGEGTDSADGDVTPSTSESAPHDASYAPDSLR